MKTIWKIILQSFKWHPIVLPSCLEFAKYCNPTKPVVPKDKLQMFLHDENLDATIRNSL